MTTDDSSSVRNKLPWWTWVVPIILLHAGTEISLHFKYAQGVSDFYLPTGLALLLIQWWGPARVLPAMYINAVLSTPLWGIPSDRWPQWFVYALPETLFVAISWCLFRLLWRGKYWLPDIRSVLLFLAFAICIPILIEVVFLQSLLVWFGDQSADNFWAYIARNGLAEFTSNFGLVAPALFYGTPWMLRKKLLISEPSEPIRIQNVHEHLRVRHVIEIAVAFLLTFMMLFVLDFQEYWFIYGLFSVYIAIRYGFGPATLANYYIFIITYIAPRWFSSVGWMKTIPENEITHIFLGTSLLYVFAAITGRTITDVWIAENKLQKQNEELEHANAELDRFVYSVSHDLSAPLKSILGLVNIGRLSQNSGEQISYLGKIETSVKKLESFIREVLDYSQNKKLDIVVEQIKLQDLCKEILDNLKYFDQDQSLEVDMKEISDVEITHDKTRLRIILNNILANAIKYQKRVPGHRPRIKISSSRKRDRLVINVEDNGEGIHPEVKARIFNMFFRGHHDSTGSGLGLYIAKEAAEKIGGNISVKSEYGEGSTFSIEISVRGKH
jgi:signal transduction histidine kinase